MCDDSSARVHDAIFSEHGTSTMVRDERYKMVVDGAGDATMRDVKTLGDVDITSRRILVVGGLGGSLLPGTGQ